MSKVQTTQSGDGPRRTVFLIGDEPWNRDRIVQQALEAGLRVVRAKLASDHSEALAAKVHPEKEASQARTEPETTETLPDDPEQVSGPLLARLRQDYGEDFCLLPLNDYVTEYAAALSAKLSERCYPVRSAETAKRKHMLRDLWNRLAAEPDSGLFPVEYCYAELRGDGSDFELRCSSGFEALPEATPLIVKPDELSSSIEIRRVSSKQEALAAAREVCRQLREKWYEVGRSIGTEVRPRVVIETAIQASSAYQPGAEFSIEFVSCGGRHHPVGVTQKWTGPYCIETGQLFPAESFPASLRPVAERSVKRLLEELEAGYCVSHWEFIVTPDDRLGLVEGHLRAAGDRIMELVEQSTGLAPPAALCQALAGRRADFPFTPRRACAVLWLIPESPLAEVTDIRIDHDAVNGLCEDLYVNKEAILATTNWTRATDWVSRFAHVLAVGDDFEDIARRCREVARSVVLSGSGDHGSASTTLQLSIDQFEASLVGG